jgi:AcrR family transcriptional regulator
MQGVPEPTDRSTVPLVARTSIAGVDDATLRALPRRHHLSRDAVAASQSARILVATAEVVAENGYAATSVADIIERAGVSRRTFYELYTGKEDAFSAAYGAVDVLIDRISAAALQHDQPRDQVRVGVRTFLDGLAQEPAFTRMFVIEAVGAGPRIRDQRADAFRRFADVLRIPVAAARAHDPAVPDPDDALLLALLGGVLELVLHHVHGRDATTLAEVAPVAEYLLETVLLTPRPGSAQTGTT